MTARAGQSLRDRLLVNLWAPVLGVLFCGALGGYVVARYIGNSVHDQWLLDSALSLASQIRGRDGRAAIEVPQSAMDMFEWDRVDRIYEEVRDAEGRVLIGNTPFPAPPIGVVPGAPQYRDDLIDGRPVRIVAISIIGVAGLDKPVLVQVGETLGKREAIASTVLLNLLPLQLFLLVIGVIVVWQVVTRNLRRVADVADRLRGYHADALGPLEDAASAPTEIRPLVEAINELISGLQEHRDAQRRFVANAAHQLRTPLAALQVQIQRALREADPLRQREALTDVHRAVSRLHHIAHQLLTLLRTERVTEAPIPLGEVDLGPIAREALEAWTDAALERDMDLGYEGPEDPVPARGDAQLLREMLDNLIDNAIRYGRRGGTITLTLVPHPLAIHLDDDGPGIAEDQRELVMERFHRGATGDARGCGLGLAIAREIALRHSARLRLLEPPLRAGLRVSVEFP